MNKQKLIKTIIGKIKKRIKGLRITNNNLLNLGHNSEYQFNCNVIKGLAISLSVIENEKKTQENL